MSDTFQIHIIGLGVADEAVFSKPAQQAFEESDLVIGSDRQLKIIDKLLTVKQQKSTLPKLPQLKNLLEENISKTIVLLASGDPLFYGVGSWLIRNIGMDSLNFYPAVSSIQVACHSIGVALQDVDVLSLHGRPLEKIRSKLKRQQNLMILTDQHSQPHHLANECLSAGYTESLIWVCENMGYPQQHIRRFSLDELISQPDLTFEPLHVCLIQTGKQGGYLPEFPGIPDANFITDKELGKGMITKREVRLVILSMMQPANNDVIWDIGAGCGGVSIELAYWNENAQVHAIENNQQRLSCLEQNRLRFGVVSNLNIVSNRAPECLADLPPANKVFIGGSDGELQTLLELSWSQLPQDGLLVASAVTENSKNILMSFSEKLAIAEKECLDFETSQISISRGNTLAGQLMYQPNLPVTVYKFHKIRVAS